MFSWSTLTYSLPCRSSHFGSHSAKGVSTHDLSATFEDTVASAKRRCVDWTRVSHVWQTPHAQRQNAGTSTRMVPEFLFWTRPTQTGKLPRTHTPGTYPETDPSCFSLDLRREAWNKPRNWPAKHLLGHTSRFGNGIPRHVKYVYCTTLHNFTCDCIKYVYIFFVGY